VRHVVWFELRRRLRDGMTYAALFAFMVVLGIGAWLYWQSLPPRASGGRLFGEAYLLALVIGCHAGIAHDRTQHFDRYLTANFLAPAALYFGKVATTILYLVLFAVLSLVLALLTSAGSAGYAARYSLVFFLATLLMLPLLVLTELLITTRYPGPLIVVGFFAFLTIYGSVNDPRPLLSVLGMEGSVEAVPAIVRSGLALLATSALYPLFRLRLGRQHLARSVTPP
jgi:hypothetical protein